MQGKNEPILLIISHIIHASVHRCKIQILRNPEKLARIGTTYINSGGNPRHVNQLQMIREGAINESWLVSDAGAEGRCPLGPTSARTLGMKKLKLVRSRCFKISSGVPGFSSAERKGTGVEWRPWQTQGALCFPHFVWKPPSDPLVPSSEER